MSDIASLSRTASPASPTPSPAASRPAARPAAAAHRGPDRVELSSVAQQASRAETSGVRQDVVDRVRGEIAAGNYETPERLDTALDKLMKDLL